MNKKKMNALTIDVEDYFMVSAFESQVPKSDWTKYEVRAMNNTRKVLDLLRETGTKATFFTLGWLAERYPDMVRDIYKEGHEVASHGYSHSLIYNQTRDEFRDDVRRAKQILEKAIGAPVYGYRAPSFSVINETQWALDVLREEGYTYDASIFPAPHARGGLMIEDRRPHKRQGLLEFPVSTLQLGGKDFPFAGGGYFRLFPYALVRWSLQRCNKQGLPGVIYLHPWEFDPQQPRLKGRFVDEFKHYVNLEKTESKFRRLTNDFQFTTVRDILSAEFGPFAASK